jgi:hypothetical protein
MSGNGNGGGVSWKADFLIRMIRDVGFPIVVAAYLLYQIPLLREVLVRLNGTLGEFSKMMAEQTQELREHRRISEHMKP